MTRMTATRQDRVLGREFWKLLHIIAANFPDGSALTQQRLRGYYDFFNSLQHVLPRSSWRTTWRYATSHGDTELSWQGFQTLRDHRQLSRWLFGVHDAVREELRQPKSKTSYANLYTDYKKYREGATGTKTTVPDDPTGVDRLKDLLQTRPRAIDEFLVKLYGTEYSKWTRARKQALRKSHMDDAAKYFWATLSNKASRADNTFNSLPANKRRNRVISQFDFEYRLRHQRIADLLVGLPGALKEKVLA